MLNNNVSGVRVVPMLWWMCIYVNVAETHAGHLLLVYYAFVWGVMMCDCFILLDYCILLCFYYELQLCYYDVLLLYCDALLLY